MTETRIDQHNLVDQLRAAFPEVEKEYQLKVVEYDGEFPGNYNVLAFVFEPYVKRELAKRELTDLLQRLARFMERVCASGDVEAINVVWLKLFKPLLAEPKDLKLLWPILGAATRANIEDAARRWGLIGSLPMSGVFGALGGWPTSHL